MPTTDTCTRCGEPARAAASTRRLVATTSPLLLVSTPIGDGSCPMSVAQCRCGTGGRPVGPLGGVVLVATLGRLATSVREIVE